MGYCIEQQDSFFRIPGDKAEACRVAISKIFENASVNIRHSTHSEPQIGWIRKSDINPTMSLADLFAAFRWEIMQNVETSEVISIDFTGEKMGEDIDVLMATIAPFVAAGSYIAMLGEDGSHWMYKFDGSSYREVTGKVVYEDDED